MRAEAIDAGRLRVARENAASPQKAVLAEGKIARTANGWSEERFARDQIRGLVRQIFGSDMSPKVRHVVFTSPEPETEVRDICLRVGEALAVETEAQVAIITRELGLAGQQIISYRRDACTQVTGNLWRAPFPFDYRGRSAESLHHFLTQIRSDFEFSLIAAGTEQDEALALTHFADGVVLVVSALKTRRATARRLLENLSHVRIFGTVLRDREFPIPDAIYRRL